MDCVNCGAPLPPKTTRCPFCQTLNDVDLRGRITVRRGESSRDCPRCRKALTAVLLQVGAEAVEIDRCVACYGLFFDPGEIESVLDAIETRAVEVDHRQLLTLIEQETPTGDFEQVAYVPCPDCGQLMHRRQFGQQSGVIVDTCRDHGLWLDGGELRRLIRWTQAGGHRHHAAADAEKQRLEAQLRKASASGGTPSIAPLPSLPSRLTTGEPDPFFGDGGGFDITDVFSLLASVIRGFR